MIRIQEQLLLPHIRSNLLLIDVRHSMPGSGRVLREKKAVFSVDFSARFLSHMTVEMKPQAGRRLLAAAGGQKIIPEVVEKSCLFLSYMTVEMKASM